MCVHPTAGVIPAGMVAVLAHRGFSHSGLVRLDQHWYLDVNRFARSTSFAHGFMHWYALYVGVGILGVLLVLGWWRARRAFDPRKSVTAAIWAGAGTIIAVALNQPLGHLVGRPRPFLAFPHAEVLVPKTNDFTFPSDHAVVAGAVIAGLFLLGDRLLAWIAVVVGLFLAFARVYVGAHYPADVIAGLLFGAFVVVVLGFLGRPLIRLGVDFAADARGLRVLVVAPRRRAAPAHSRKASAEWVP